MARILKVMVRKGVNAAITIFGIICLNYALLRLMPGDPALSLTPRDPKYQGLAEYNRELFGFDKPPGNSFSSISNGPSPWTGESPTDSAFPSSTC